MKRAFIIHGWGATPKDHWFPWLAGSLKARGYRVDVPALPNPTAPVFSDWQHTLARHIGTPQPDDLFVAHSLGGITLLHYLSQTRPKEIGGLVLVSAFAEKLPALPEIEGYSIDDYVVQARPDLPAIRAMTANTACIVSGNDSIVAPEASLKLANALQARVITVPDAGHFLASDGFDTLPQVLQAVENFRSKGA
ncbi:alpha/beta hydrolase [Neisseria sp.]|uniref:RBBP9/YdeN family alpha/beta hydrolase n=1 Tax=Neisseria sp. TaxID=192066 RepID=UPI0026DCECB2|nr:alpha/beta fold hydrolase [Neisseria sp.]MDO4907003.1 alpha/beta hydrolase [Neisseria sp.]